MASRMTPQDQLPTEPSPLCHLGSQGLWKSVRPLLVSPLQPRPGVTKQPSSGILPLSCGPRADSAALLASRLSAARWACASHNDASSAASPPLDPGFRSPGNVGNGEPYAALRTVVTRESRVVVSAA